MRKYLRIIYYILISTIVNDFCFQIKTAKAFLPTINEPSQIELKSTSIQIGQTAIQLIQLGKIESGIKFLELAVTLNPEEHALWVTLADANIRLNKNKEALIYLNKAILLKPKKETLYFTKGSVYMNMNDPKKAIQFIKKGLSLNNKNENGYFLLGNAETMLKNHKSALIAFQTASNLNSSFWQSINNEGLILYELNNLKKAMSRFKLALKISKNAEPMLALAIVLYVSDNNFIESINLAKQALIANPKYVSKIYQSKQLWGKELQKGAELLFKTEEMNKAVKEAKEKSQ